MQAPEGTLQEGFNFLIPNRTPLKRGSQQAHQTKSIKDNLLIKNLLEQHILVETPPLPISAPLVFPEVP